MKKSGWLRGFLHCMIGLCALGLAACAGSQPIAKYDKTTYGPEKIIEVPADSRSGFHWPYFISVPRNALKYGSPLPMLVIPNNTGTATDDDGRHREEARDFFQYAVQLMDETGVPFVLLTPVFPRYATRMGGGKYYTHALDRDTMTIADTRGMGVTLKWGGRLLTETDFMSFNLDNLFMVQDNLIYRCMAADFNTRGKIAGVSALELTFLFEMGMDVQRPFNIIEFPRNGGLFFKDVHLTADGKIVNGGDVSDASFQIADIAPRRFGEIPRLWDAKGEPYQGDPMAAIRRPDLQLLAMVDDAREKLKSDLGLESQEKFVLFGFSASGMFSDRFCFLHPERVKAAVIGSPGGLPMTPLSGLQGEKLRYPMGISDFQEISGKPFDAESFRRIPRYLYLGGEDDNDSVIFRDGFDPEDERIVFKAVGRTPQDRFQAIHRIFTEQGFDRSEFVLYPGARHEMTPEMWKDIKEFLVRNNMQ